MGIALAGIGVGVVSSLALTRVMSSLLYDVEPSDPQTFVVVAAAFATIALVACCVPAIEAAHVDPADDSQETPRSTRRDGYWYQSQPSRVTGYGIRPVLHRSVYQCRPHFTRILELLETVVLLTDSTTRG